MVAAERLEVPIEEVADERQPELGDEQDEDETDVEDRADDGEDDPAGSAPSVYSGESGRTGREPTSSRCSRTRPNRLLPRGERAATRARCFWSRRW